jgi:hypothetical protein
MLTLQVIAKEPKEIETTRKEWADFIFNSIFRANNDSDIVDEEILSRTSINQFQKTGWLVDEKKNNNYYLLKNAQLLCYSDEKVFYFLFFFFKFY